MKKLENIYKSLIKKKLVDLDSVENELLVYSSPYYKTYISILNPVEIMIKQMLKNAHLTASPRIKLRVFCKKY